MCQINYGLKISKFYGTKAILNSRIHCWRIEPYLGSKTHQRYKKLSVLLVPENAATWKHLRLFLDDSAMARQVSASLLNCKKMDNADMATRFKFDYFEEPGRGYGMNVVDIFRQWRDSTAELNDENVLLPSKRQFQGNGSYGNGGAMRVAPVALFAKTKNECMEVAKASAFLTHSHRCGYNGAILQALAVYKSLHSQGSIQWETFLEELQNDVKTLDGENDSEDGGDENGGEGTLDQLKQQFPRQGASVNNLYDYTRSQSFTFSKQLRVIKLLLTKYHKHKANDDDISDTTDVIQLLGRDVSAQEAVPAALYSFLRNLGRGFEETLYYAIGLGGDTDTIGTMCTAMCGAHYGYESIPKAWRDACEAHDEVLGYANRFHEMHQG